MNIDQNTQVSPNDDDPTISHHGEAPPDPSNTSHIGQPVEQGVIKKNEGITQQSSELEDLQDHEVPGEGDNSFDKQVENYLKNPSPEDINSSDQNS